MINVNERLTENFELWEFLVGLNDSDIEQMDSLAVSYLRLLCELILQPIRNRFGKVIITSGFRSVRKNQEVDGDSNSFHLYGKAADFVTPGANHVDVYCWIQNHLPYTELGLYEDGHIHIAYSENARQKNPYIIGYGNSAIVCEDDEHFQEMHQRYEKIRHRFAYLDNRMSLRDVMLFSGLGFLAYKIISSD